jgi:hypothetical protein
LTITVFQGRSDFQSQVIQTFQWAAEQGCSVIQAWDAAFADWPLSDSGLLEAVRVWASPNRSLQLLALEYEELPRRHPKFVRWRRDFGHCVTARAVEPELRLDAAPQALLLCRNATQWRSLRLFDRHYWRGEVSETAADWQRGAEWIDAVAQRSCEAFAATTLGL